MDGLASTGMQDVLVAGMIDQTAPGALATLQRRRR